MVAAGPVTSDPRGADLGPGRRAGGSASGAGVGGGRMRGGGGGAAGQRRLGDGVQQDGGGRSPVGEAFVRLRAYAYAQDRRLAEVARDVVARRLRLSLDGDLPQDGER